MHGSHLLESWAVFQKVCSLSSAESEFYAIGSGAARGLMIKNAINEMREAAGRDDPLDMTVESDSTAAKGMVQRHGVGRVRHLATRYLWIQESQRSKDFIVSKVEGKENRADIGTKPVDRVTLERLLPRTGVCGLRSLGWQLPQTAVPTIASMAPPSEAYDLTARGTNEAWSLNDVPTFYFDQSAITERQLITVIILLLISIVFNLVGCLTLLACYLCRRGPAVGPEKRGPVKQEASRGTRAL